MNCCIRQSAVVVAAFAVVSGSNLTALAQAIQQGSIKIGLDLVATVSGGANVAPNFGAHSGDPRFLYIGQQNGIIRTLDFNQSNPLLGTDFLNVRTVLGNSFTGLAAAERGLLGGAFHPNFHNAGQPGYRKFYTFTSESLASGTPNFMHQTETTSTFLYHHQSVIREWTAGAPNVNGVTTIDTSIPSRVLMRIAKPQAGHNAGAIVFGPDNYMYVSLGDGGCCYDRIGNTSNNMDGHTNVGDPDTPGGYSRHGNAQDRRNVYGKIIRIQPTIEEDPLTGLSANGQYRIPNDNPYTSASNDATPIPGWQASWVDEIWAYGFRNPFRIGFDRETGDLYAGDVGQTQGDSNEEVDRVIKGGNYGWVMKEGTDNTFFNYPAPANTTLINPLGQYPTGGSGVAVIGGFVYRGEAIPKLQGKYVFGDLIRDLVEGLGGGILYMNVDQPGSLPNGLNQIYDIAVTGPMAIPNSNVHGVAEGADGELYFLFNNGNVVKLVAPETGDFNHDGEVDAADYVMWRSGLGAAPTEPNYNLWTAHFGESPGGGSQTVPEPTAGAILFFATAASLVIRRRTAICTLAIRSSL